MARIMFSSKKPTVAESTTTAVKEGLIAEPNYRAVSFDTAGSMKQLAEIICDVLGEDAKINIGGLDFNVGLGRNDYNYEVTMSVYSGSNAHGDFNPVEFKDALMNMKAEANKANDAIANRQAKTGEE